MSTASRAFYPLLTRRDSYSVKANGEYYGYAYYRDEIAEDCQHRCVYCDSHANETGGAEAMQLDHFRPDSLPEFTHLANDPRNLHYACGRCNLWKSNLWPALGVDATHNGSEGFTDPFSDDRLKFFKVSSDGTISPLQPPAAYMIRLFRLDREFLRKVRVLRKLRYEWKEQVAAMRQKAGNGEMPRPEEFARTLAAIESLLL